MILRKILLLAVFAGLGLVARAQQPGTDLRNQRWFKTKAQEASALSAARKAQATELAKKRGLPVYLNKNNNFAVLRRFENGGHPVYYKLYNQAAAITSGTNRLRRGGGLGLNLTGNGMTVGIWDGGGFNESHREFQGRAETRGGISDDPIQGLGGDHSTHVTGTVGAAGINPEARGMAPDADLFVYDFLNDDAEIAAELAKDEPLLVSNHSYGRILGWDFSGGGWTWRGNTSVSSTEDYLFGFYNTDSQLWDEYMYNAPYYLMVKAAGNDRSDVGNGPQPADGPYDVLDPQAVSKNLLTVGAVETITEGYEVPEDVVMSEFSSWGPTDDGRIKPDLVAAGVNILSSVDGGPEAYGTLSGTSMASPTVAGSLILLQQLYSQVNQGDFMRAATLKALAIHTTLEAGEFPGPDYRHGWGLFSADRAASVIIAEDNSSTIIREGSMRDQQVVALTVQSNGTQPLVATLCWTDLPGNPVSPQLDPEDLMLVNDLDLRIQDEEGNIFEPWVMDPSRPEREATKGDNFRDNVEKIEIAAPLPGTYTITITHKGELAEERQAYSLVVSSSNLDTDLQTLYWIGGANGEWHNGNNWSLRSGGPASGRVPDIETPVIFNENSSGANSTSVSLDRNAACFNLSFTPGLSVSFDLGGNTLTLNGSLDVESQGVTFNNGTIELAGQISKRNFIRSPGSTLSGVNVLVRGNNARWNMLTPLNVQSLRVEGGGLSVVNQSVSAGSIQFPLGSGQVFEVAGSTISVERELLLNPGLLADFSGSTIVFDGSSGQNSFVFDGAEQNFHNIIADGVNLEISGNNTYNKIEVDGTLTLNGRATIDSLLLEPGSTLNLASNRLYNITRAFEATGQAGLPITIQSTGGSNATLNTDDTDLRFCFDYLQVQDVSVQGNTDFVAGNNSNISASSQGWFIGDCSDALFGDFSVAFLCEQGNASFTDQSTGEPISWRWNFGDFQFPERNTSTEQNPSHVYSFAGEYLVTLEVSDGELTRTITRRITVAENNSGLAVPTIVIEGQQLQSSVLAPDYQWYLNGEPLPGENGRSVSATSDGAYSVEVSNGQCRFISDVATVGSLASDLDTGTLKVYPVPASDMASVKWRNTYRGQLQVVLYNALGQAVWQQQATKSSGEFSLQLSTGQLKPGVYQLVVATPAGTLGKKLLVK